MDGQPVAIAPDPPDGLVGLDLPPGDHEVKLWYGTTPDRLAGAAISAIAALIVVSLAVADRETQRDAGVNVMRFA